MSILWCGGEDIDFPNGAPLNLSQTAGDFRANYARGAVNLSYVGGYTASDAFPGGGVTSCWLSYRIRTQVEATLMHVGLGNISDYATGVGIWLGVSNVYGQLRLFKRTGGTTTTLATETGNSYTNGTLKKFDICVTTFGASCNIKVYIDGGAVATIDWSGDLSALGISTLNCIMLWRGFAYWAFCSEFIVADADTRSLALVTHYPNAAGDANAWTGAYTDIDEWTTVDSDLVYVNTNDQEVQMNLSALPSGVFAVRGVWISARAVTTSDATPTKLALGIKSTTINNGSDQTLALYWASYYRFMDVNPVTTNPWTQAEIDALQLNLKSRA